MPYNDLTAVSNSIKSCVCSPALVRAVFPGDKFDHGAEQPVCLRAQHVTALRKRAASRMSTLVIAKIDLDPS